MTWKRSLDQAHTARTEQLDPNLPERGEECGCQNTEPRRHSASALQTPSCNRLGLSNSLTLSLPCILQEPRVSQALSITLTTAIKTPSYFPLLHSAENKRDSVCVSPRCQRYFGMPGAAGRAARPRRYRACPAGGEGCSPPRYFSDLEVLQVIFLSLSSDDRERQRIPARHRVSPHSAGKRIGRLWGGKRRRKNTHALQKRSAELTWFGIFPPSPRP